MAEKEDLDDSNLELSENEVAVTDDENDEDESEDVEPRLIYERIENEVKQIVEKDAISSVCVHEKFVAIGTHWGKIFILDQLGTRFIGNLYFTTLQSTRSVSI
ncbi:Vacuolar protein sorting-associated protein 41 -like protein [Halotydeus destructor]|nr:Vacuolar protein sorting-associated protein 41 -like protein [Halotydeus destructor]